jgi:hypothetical protein
MAQTGYTPIQLYYSSTTTNAPLAANLAYGELAINITDGKLFYKDNANAVQVISWKVTPTSAGGTGLTSYVAGDMVYYASGTTFTKLAIASNGYYISSSGTAPQWSAPAALTKTDDTNVTLTLGGNASTALLNAASLTLGWTGQLGVTRGGTGLSSVAQGDILYGSASNTLSALAKNTTATRYLSNTGTTNNPAWAQIDLTNGVTGTLPVGNGGTGTATTFTSGSVLYAGASGVYSQNNASLFWDASTSRLGIGGNTPARRLQVDATTGGPGLRITNTNSNSGIEILTSATKKSWLLGAQYNVDQSFEITPSTADGGTTFSNPSFLVGVTSVRPGADNTFTLGTSGLRWSTVYAATGTINTSDARKKTSLSVMTASEINAAKQLAQEVGTFKFLDAIENKGQDNARIHCGLTVQRAIEIMESNGLKPFDYAFICYDKWDDVYKDFVINQGEKVKVVKQAQKTQVIKKKQSLIEIKDGVAIMSEKEIEFTENVVQQIPVFDENNQPIFEETTDDQGNIVRKQMMFDVPVMEEIEIEVDAEPKYESRLVQKASDVYGFRVDELTMFMIRGLVEELK